MSQFIGSLVSVVVTYVPKKIPFFKLVLQVNGEEMTFLKVWDLMDARVSRHVKVSHRGLKDPVNVSKELVINHFKVAAPQEFVVDYIEATRRYRISRYSLDRWFEDALKSAKRFAVTAKAKEWGIGGQKLTQILSSL